MFHHLILLVCALQLALAAPQFVTFKDGKVGVNFGGYHAEAGLGGLLTGNAAHGGLSASAGTPWGPQAAAGLNGALDGRAAGGAYAGAQFNPEIGASSVLSGSVGDGKRGFAGAEAHSNVNHVSKTYVQEAPLPPVYPSDAVPSYNVQQVEANSIQKIKPPKKYNLVRNESDNHAADNNSDDNNSNSKSSLTKTNIKTIFATVDSRPVDRVNSETNSNYQPSALASPTSLSASAAADKTTTITKVVGGHVVADDSRSGIIIVNKNRHRERKQKLHQRRRLSAHSRHRLPSNLELDGEREVPLYVEGDAMPIGAALSDTTAAAAAVFLDTNPADIPPTVAHSKHILKSVYKEVRPPTGHSVVATKYTEPGYENRHSDVQVNSGLIGNVLNIPIGILRSLQESLAGVSINKSVSHTKL